PNARCAANRRGGRHLRAIETAREAGSGHCSSRVAWPGCGQGNLIRCDMALRLIALFKLLKGLLLGAVGLAALRLLHADVAGLVTVWADRLNIDPQNRYLGDVLARLTSLDARALVIVAMGSFAYASLLTTEGIGLWLKRRWAEYFTIVVTGSFIP